MLPAFPAPEVATEIAPFSPIVKVGVEVVLTPLTYKVIGALKRAEREDWYDRDTDFTPFRF